MRMRNVTGSINHQILETKRSMESEALFDIAGVSNENDEWYTPSWLFRALGVEFSLDPCSPGVPPSSVPAIRHLTKDDNGLTADWDGCVWLNPPFSSKRAWYERLVAHGDGIALMPARTETHDLQTYMEVADSLLFLKGRIYFERGHRPGGNGVGGVITAPPFGVLLCAYGPLMSYALLHSELQGVRAKTWPRCYSEEIESPIREACEREPDEPDGECFRGGEAEAYTAEQQARIQRELK
jgi:hypothetical protein